MRSLCFQLYPFLTSEEVNEILAETADPIAEGICHSGRLDIFGALIEAALSASKGHIALDRDYYNCDSNIGFLLVDGDLSEESTHDVNTTSSSGDSETVILTRGTGPAGTFRGTIHTTAGTQISEMVICKLLMGTLFMRRITMPMTARAIRQR